MPKTTVPLMIFELVALHCSAGSEKHGRISAGQIHVIDFKLLYSGVKTMPHDNDNVDNFIVDYGFCGVFLLIN